MVNNSLPLLSGMDLVIPVNGFEGAKAYKLGPSCRIPLFDNDKDVFYIKTTDQNGFPAVKAYKFEEIIEVSKDESAAVSLSDIRSIMREEFGKMMEDVLNAKQPVSTANDQTVKSEPIVSHNKYDGQGRNGKQRNTSNQSDQSGSNSKPVVNG